MSWRKGNVCIFLWNKDPLYQWLAFYVYKMSGINGTYSAVFFFVFCSFILFARLSLTLLSLEIFGLLDFTIISVSPLHLELTLLLLEPALSAMIPTH